MAISQAKRISLDELCCQIIKFVALRGTCLRHQIGALLFKDGDIISTGYSGACKNIMHCTKNLKCIRDLYNIPSGTRLEFCFSPHAELNAILNAAKKGISTKGSILWSTHKPCLSCLKAAINADITKISYLKDYGDKTTASSVLYQKLLEQSGIILELYKEK